MSKPRSRSFGSFYWSYSCKWRSMRIVGRDLSPLLNQLHFKLVSQESSSSPKIHAFLVCPHSKSPPESFRAAPLLEDAKYGASESRRGGGTWTCPKRNPMIGSSPRWRGIRPPSSRERRRRRRRIDGEAPDRLVITKCVQPPILFGRRRRDRNCGGSL